MAEVLVVDDDDDIRELITMRVRRAGHTVTSIGDPRVALERAAGLHVDLALLDWSMPFMNGGELCAGLRRLPHLADLTVAMVTAYSEPGIRACARAAGASGYLAKPFALPELDQYIADQLAARVPVPREAAD